jgi:hypothetical protein
MKGKVFKYETAVIFIFDISQTIENDIAPTTSIYKKKVQSLLLITCLICSNKQETLNGYY